jgi:hypothetical protein
MKKPTPLQVLNQAHDLHKESFAGGFHTTLWEVLANNAFAAKVVAFTHNYRDGGNQLGIAAANEAGYSPTPAYFKDGLPYDEVSRVLDSLNEIVFGLNKELALRIVASSVAAQKHEAA